MQNYDQAVSIIKEQMDVMKNGDFTEQELIRRKLSSETNFLKPLIQQEV